LLKYYSDTNQIIKMIVNIIPNHEVSR